MFIMAWSWCVCHFVECILALDSGSAGMRSPPGPQLHVREMSVPDVACSRCTMISMRRGEDVYFLCMDLAIPETSVMMNMLPVCMTVQSPKISCMAKWRPQISLWNCLSNSATVGK